MSTEATEIMGIVEVKTVHSESEANRLLRGGWKLLHVAQQTSFGKRHNTHPAAEDLESVFVLGRPDGVNYV